MNDNILFENQLFENMRQTDIENVFSHFNVNKFKKNENIFSEGDTINQIFLIKSGSVEITKFDFDGNKNIVALLKENDMFAESVALSANNTTPYTVTSLEKSVIYGIYIETYNNLAKKYPQLMLNMQQILASKNTYLTFKIDCISKKIIKERVFELFRYYYIKNGSNVIKLPYNKNQLADFLCVNRSALSREMSIMQDEGIFKEEKKTYIINEEYFNKM